MKVVHHCFTEHFYCDVCKRPLDKVGGRTGLRHDIEIDRVKYELRTGGFIPLWYPPRIPFSKEADLCGDCIEKVEAFEKEHGGIFDYSLFRKENTKNAKRAAN